MATHRSAAWLTEYSFVTVAAKRFRVYAESVEATERWVRVGHATGAAGFDAGFVAAGQAVGDGEAELLIVFRGAALASESPGRRRDQAVIR